jgi:hypothetical protein
MRTASSRWAPAGSQCRRQLRLRHQRLELASAKGRGVITVSVFAWCVGYVRFNKLPVLGLSLLLSSAPASSPPPRVRVHL